MRCTDRTTMGGDNEGFPTTAWTRMREVHSSNQAQRRLVLDQLLGRYWKPVYCYLRRKGHDNESAKDLTQGFFVQIVLGRGLVDKADQARGRFRTLVLTALDRYVIDCHRRQTSEKGGGPDGMPNIPFEDLPDLPADGKEARPDEAFNYAWATALLDEVLARIETDSRRNGQALHWEVFKARVLTPIQQNTRPAPLAEVCRRLGIADPSSASNMIVTVKRRFRSVLLETLGEHVDCPSEAEEELNALMEALGCP
jgi:RNA polymerase sigma-70 factor (ECF subfamily)